MRKLNAKNRDTEIRLQEIIEAALLCFTQNGIPQTRMEDIRNKSGASIGSIYHHFKSRENLAASVYLEGIRRYQEELLEVFRKKPDAREGIFRAVSCHLKWVKNYPDWARFLFQERYEKFMDDKEEEFLALNRNFFDQIMFWVEKHMETGAIKRIPHDIFISLLLGPCHEYSRLYLFGHLSMDIDKAAEILGEKIWFSLKGMYAECDSEAKSSLFEMNDNGEEK